MSKPVLALAALLSLAATPALAQDALSQLLRGSQTPSAETQDPATTTTPSQETGDDQIAGLNQGVLDRNRAVDERNAQAMADWEAGKRALAEQHARDYAAWEAQVRAQQEAHQREYEAWQARAAACEAGDLLASEPQ